MRRGALIWPAMILAGLALGGYVYAAWPESAVPKPTARSQPVRTIASVGSSDAFPEMEVSGVAGAFYPGYLYVYEVTPTPLLDALIQAPASVDVP